jgi:hypothetical protein
MEPTGGDSRERAARLDTPIWRRLFSSVEVLISLGVLSVIGPLFRFVYQAGVARALFIPIENVHPDLSMSYGAVLVAVPIALFVGMIGIALMPQSVIVRTRTPRPSPRWLTNLIAFLLAAMLVAAFDLFIAPDQDVNRGWPVLVAFAVLFGLIRAYSSLIDWVARRAAAKNGDEVRIADPIHWINVAVFALSLTGFVLGTAYSTGFRTAQTWEYFYVIDGSPPAIVLLMESDGYVTAAYDPARTLGTRYQTLQWHEWKEHVPMTFTYVGKLPTPLVACFPGTSPPRAPAGARTGRRSDARCVPTPPPLHAAVRARSPGVGAR